MRQIIGMDGGGTSTKAALYEINEDGSIGAVIREAKAGSCNVNSTSAEKIEEAFRTIWQELHPENPVAVCLGAAGISTPGAKDTLLELLTKAGFPDRKVLKGDHEIALRGALGKCPGILLIAGTGAIAFGQDQEGNLVRTGGYGFLLDDEGSAFAMGRQLLQEWILSQDGRRASSPLLDALTVKLAENGVKPLDTALHLAYDQPFVKSRIADLARLVGEFLEKEDPVAQKIGNQAVQQLSLLVLALAEKLSETVAFAEAVDEDSGVASLSLESSANPEFGEKQEIPVVFAGSVLQQNVWIRQEVSRIIEKENSRIRVVEAMADPIWGAAALAWEDYYA